MRAFYNSQSWQRVSEYVRRRDSYLCQECIRYGKRVTAKEVHHVYPLEEWPTLALDERNLITLCRKCHNKMENRNSRKLSAAGKALQARVSKKYRLSPLPKR